MHQKDQGKMLEAEEAKSAELMGMNLAHSRNRLKVTMSCAWQIKGRVILNKVRKSEARFY